MMMNGDETLLKEDGVMESHVLTIFHKIPIYELIMILNCLEGNNCGIFCNGFRLWGWRISQRRTLQADSGPRRELMWLKQAMSAGLQIFHQLNMHHHHQFPSYLSSAPPLSSGEYFSSQQQSHSNYNLVSQARACSLLVGGHCSIAGITSQLLYYMFSSNAYLTGSLLGWSLFWSSGGQIGTVHRCLQVHVPPPSLLHQSSSPKYLSRYFVQLG